MTPSADDKATAATATVQTGVLPAAPSAAPSGTAKARYDLAVVVANRLMGSSPVREKSLKVLQYGCKLVALLLGRLLREAASPWQAHFSTLSKTVSKGRRCFKFLRWVKHFEDVDDALAESSPGFACLLWLNVSLNLAGDLAEDFVSLGKLGFVRKGSVPPSAERHANQVQLALAFCDLAVGAVKLARSEDAVREAERAGDAAKCRERATLGGGRAGSLGVSKLALKRLDIVKFVADVVKQWCDLGMWRSSERAFVTAGLVAGSLSTFKYSAKALAK